MTNSPQIHSVDVRFNLITKETVEELFDNTNKYFSEKHKEKDGWFKYDNEEMLRIFGNYFNYIYECFGNFIDNTIDSETCLDIAVLDLSEEHFPQTDMILFYQGKLGGENILSYVLRDEKCDVFSARDNLKDSEELANAIQEELTFLNFAAGIKADVIRNFNLVRKSFDMIKNNSLSFEAMQELLSATTQTSKID